MNIWFTSDTHYNHKKIIKGQSDFGYRVFNNLEEHNLTLINTINKYVKKDDILYHLGDWSLGGRAAIRKFRENLNCLNIHLTLGNHDVLINKNFVYDDGVKVQDLFTSVKQIIYKKIHNINFMLGHYAYRYWQNGARGSINLHGDAHGSAKPYEKLLQIADDPYLYKTGDLYKQFDVGIDVAFEMFKEYRPFHIDEIKNLMSNRINIDIKNY